MTVGTASYLPEKTCSGKSVWYLFVWNMTSGHPVAASDTGIKKIVAYWFLLQVSLTIENK